MTSGDIGVHNGSPVNGITHAKYTEAVDKEFKKYLTRWFRENKGKTKLDAEGMQKFIMNLIEGKGADGRVNDTIQRYNRGILARCRLPEADRPYKVVLKATAKDKMAIVTEIVKQKPWKRRMAIINSVLAVQVMGIFTEVAAQQIQAGIDTLGDEKFQQWFQQAMSALQNGDVNTARQYLIDANNSCLQVLQDKAGNLFGLGVVQNLEKAIDRILEKYERYHNNNWNGTEFDWIRP
jgi:hypothetical protein